MDYISRYFTKTNWEAIFSQGQQCDYSKWEEYFYEYSIIFIYYINIEYIIFYNNFYEANCGLK